MFLGYLGIDQYGQHYHIKKHPREELLDKLGRKHASKMCVDLEGGGYRQKGYVIGGLWIDVLEVHNVSKWKVEGRCQA